MIQLDTVITRNDSVLFNSLGAELVMMNIDKGEYYNLDVIGAHIWTLLEQPIIISSLCERLMTEYAVEVQTCQQDVLDFVREMSALDVVTILADKKS